MILPLHKHPWEVLDRDGITMGHASNVAAALDLAMRKAGGLGDSLGRWVQFRRSGRMYDLTDQAEKAELWNMYRETQHLIAEEAVGHSRAIEAGKH